MINLIFLSFSSFSVISLSSILYKGHRSLYKRIFNEESIERMDERMDSDSIFPQTKKHKSGISTRMQLLFELQKAKERIISTPQPYCELDCPWLVFCRKFQLSGCILSDLIDSSIFSNIRLNWVEEDSIF